MNKALMQPIIDLVLIFEIAFFSYFVWINFVYLGAAFVALIAYLREAHIGLPTPEHDTFSDFEIPVTVLVPAYNEAAILEIGINSLLALRYSEFEIVVINDGSKDDTMEVLTRVFSLHPVVDASESRLDTVPWRGVYRSATSPRLRVIDKPNGGKSDALNSGLNLARFPLIFCADADSTYHPDALRIMGAPFVADSRTIASGASVGVRSASHVKGSVAISTGLPKALLSRFQVMEYLRSFLGSRMAWASVNALMIISGACGMYRKEALVTAGGFRTDTIWEDMEITFRLHHVFRAARRPYRIAFVPQTVCWTDVPEDLKTLFGQRAGWHRHTSEAISIHRAMIFNPKFGSVGMLSLPYFILGEWLSPPILFVGFIFTGIAALFGVLSSYAQEALIFLVLALGVLNSVSGLLLDTVAFGSFRPREIVALLWVALLENVGYRQFATYANLVGLMRWLRTHPIRGKREGIAGWRVTKYAPSRPPRLR